jgi:hypothetical protein
MLRGLSAVGRWCWRSAEAAWHSSQTLQNDNSPCRQQALPQLWCKGEDDEPQVRFENMMGCADCSQVMSADRKL